MAVCGVLQARSAMLSTCCWWAWREECRTTRTTTNTFDSAISSTPLPTTKTTSTSSAIRFVLCVSSSVVRLSLHLRSVSLQISVDEERGSLSYSLKSWNTDDDILQRIAMQLEDVQRVSPSLARHLFQNLTHLILLCFTVGPQQRDLVRVHQGGTVAPFSTRSRLQPTARQHRPPLHEHRWQ